MRAFLCLSAPLLALSSFAAAQSVVGQINGSARDPGGLVAPNVSVLIEAQATGQVFWTTANALGECLVGALPPAAVSRPDDRGVLMVSKQPHQVAVPWRPLHEVEIEVLLVRQ